MVWTSGEIITASRLEDKNDKDVINGYIGLNLNKIVTSTHRFRNMCGGFGNNYTVVAGTWAQTNNASQTDWDDILVSQAGYITQFKATDLTEIKWPNIQFNAGRYTIKIACMKNYNAGILELLHGTISIGTEDLYYNPPAGNPLYNQIVTFTYSPISKITADLRLRVNGTTGSFHSIFVSRIEIFKT